MTASGVSMLILFGVFIVAMLLEVPVAYSCILACAAYIAYAGTTSQTMIVQAIYGTADNFSLLAVPFFMIAGELMATGGIARRLINFAETLVGNKTGGFGAVVILACMVFAAISGSGTATAAAIGGICIPLMREHGYKPEHSAATVACAGALGPIIPPSTFFIIYGVIAGVSVTKLFVGGLIPGLTVTAALLLVNYLQCKREGYPVPDKKYTLSEIWREFRKAFFALLSPIVVLGCIYGGVCTPTEAAVVSVFYSIIIGCFVYRELNFRKVFEAFAKGSMTSAAIMIIMGPASALGKMLSVARVPQVIADGLMSISSSKVLFMLLVNVILIIAGMLMEGCAILTIMTPLLVPIAQAYGVDLLHLGIVMSVNLSLGLFTPPFGLNLFITSRIADVRFSSTFKHLLPLVIGTFAALLIIMYVPQLSTWLPSIMK